MKNSLKRKGYSHEKHLKKQMLLLFMPTAMLILPAICSGSRALGDEEFEAEGRIETSVKLPGQGKGGIRLSGLSGRSGSGAATKIASTKKRTIL